MRKTFVPILALALLAFPVASFAAQWYESSIAFSLDGSVNLLGHPAGNPSGFPGATVNHVEIECVGDVGTVHMYASPNEVRRLSTLLDNAADATDLL